MVMELIATIDIADLASEVLCADLTGLPPTLVQLAELDVLRSEGEALAARLQVAGAKVELEIFPGVLHGFMRSMATLSKVRNAIEKAGAWLRRAVRLPLGAPYPDIPRRKPASVRDQYILLSVRMQSAAGGSRDQNLTPCRMVPFRGRHYAPVTGPTRNDARPGRIRTVPRSAHPPCQP
jgi:hypothetical protein